MKDRKYYIDYLRIIASMAVVLLHTATTSWGYIPVKDSNWLAFNFYNAISRWGVPIFFMISGALFLSKNIPIKNIFIKYVKRLFIVFYSWSFVYAIYILLSDNNLKRVLSTFVFGEFHEWYLLTAIGLYIITPLLKEFTKDKKTTEYFLLVIFIFSFVINTTNDLLTDFGLPYAESFVFDFSITKIPCYLGYYVLGYYLDKYDLKKNNAIYFAGLCGLLITVLGSSASSIILNTPKQTLFDS